MLESYLTMKDGIMRLTVITLLPAASLLFGASGSLMASSTPPPPVTSADDEHVPLPPSVLGGSSKPASSLSQLPTAEQEDLKAIASDQGLTVDEAARRFGGAAQFNLWLEDLRKRHADRLSGAEWLPQGVGWLGFTGAAPASVSTEAAHRGLSIRISENLGYTERDVIDQVARLSEDDYVSSSVVRVAPNFRDGSLYVTRREGVHLSEDHLERALQNMRIDRPVKVLNDPDAAATVTIDYLRGGGKTSDCTAGFVVRDYWGNKGVGTAHHCRVFRGAPSASYNNWPADGDGKPVTLWYDRGSIGIAGDTGVYKAGAHAALPTFYTTRSTKRYVNHAAAGYPSVGSPVVKFGRTTGQTTGTVVATNVNRRIRGPGQQDLGEALGMVETSLLSDWGDSGGPVYYGQTALGIMSASGLFRSLHSPVSHLQYHGYGVWEQ